MVIFDERLFRDFILLIIIYYHACTADMCPPAGALGAQERAMGVLRGVTETLMAATSRLTHQGNQGNEGNQLTQL